MTENKPSSFITPNEHDHLMFPPQHSKTGHNTFYVSSTMTHFYGYKTITESKKTNFAKHHFPHRTLYIFIFFAFCRSRLNQIYQVEIRGSGGRGGYMLVFTGKCLFLIPPRYQVIMIRLTSFTCLLIRSLKKNSLFLQQILGTSHASETLLYYKTVNNIFLLL